VEEISELKREGLSIRAMTQFVLDTICAAGR